MGRTKYYSIRSYLSFMATYKTRLFVVGIFFVLANTLLALIPIFIGHFVASLASNPINRDQVFTFATILILCSVGHDLFWRSAEILFIKLLVKGNYEYENTVFYSVINKKYPYFVGKFTGKISSYVSTLGREYREFVTTIFYNYIDQLVKMPIIAGIMFSVNFYTGLVFVVSLTCMLITGRLTIKRMATAEQKSTDAVSSMDGYIIDVIANFVSVKAFKKEQTEQAKVEQKRQNVIATARQAFVRNVVFWGVLSIFVRYIIWPVTILINLHLFLNGKIGLAEMTTFMAAITIFSDYIWGTIWNVTQFTLKLARIEEAYRYLFGKRNIVPKFFADRATASIESRAHFGQSLTLKDLSFAYPDKKDRPVLQGINLEVKKNEKIGVVGRSGSGKTTLIKLLLGYYPVAKESVLLDGTPTDNRVLTSIMSYVPQDTALFHRPIRDNIAYATMAKQVTDEEIKIAAKRAHAHEFIAQTPNGYSTLVGERGIKLSMGQRQRIAIARAFLDDKPMLVLDEATSALDSESEVLVQQALEDLWQDKTVIAIAHRLSTLRHMDRIVVMEDGKIIEQGTHKQLLAQKGHYHSLWQHQIDGMIVDDLAN